MIVSRYIATEIAKPLLIGCSLLVIIFVGYRSAINLTNAASGLVPPNVALKLIVLETLIAMDVLLPTALYFSIVTGLRRMYNDSEMTALQATGVGEVKVMEVVFRFALVVSLVVGVLSMAVRPWAYQTIYTLEAEGIANTDITSLDAERFYPLDSIDSVVFAGKADAKKQRLKEVFINYSNRGNNFVVYAREARQLQLQPEFRRSMVLLDGRAYEIDHTLNTNRVIRFGSLTIQLEKNGRVHAYHSQRAVPTISLLPLSSSGGIAEFQWRLSTPVATLLFALLAVPLSRKSPRLGRRSGIVVATMVYALCFNLISIAKAWVEQGMVGKLPGLWWAYSVPALLLVVLLIKPTWVIGERRK